MALDLAIRLRAEGAPAAERDIRRVSGAVRDTGAAAGQAAPQQQRVADSLQNVQRSAAGLAVRLVGAVGLTAAFVAGLQKSREFGAAIAEVSTLLDDTSGLDNLTQKTRELSREFGTSNTDQAKALYQIISAGAADAASQTELLTAANKLAVGGVTDIRTAADGLTSVLNSYGLEASDAGRVSDVLFAAMRAGKTTIGELSGSLGQVTPLAAQAGVSFEEVAAATATLTKGGVSTSQAVTQLRGIISSVLKPTAEAKELAEGLGLSFDLQALKAQGLSGFLAEVAEKTGGNAEQMAVLFGQVEALGGSLALTGTQAQDFADVLGSIQDSAGQTDAAVEKITATADFARKRFGAAVDSLQISAGNFISKAATPLIESLTDIVSSFEDTSASGDQLAEDIEKQAEAIGDALLEAVGAAQVLAAGFRSSFNLANIALNGFAAAVADVAVGIAATLSLITLGPLSDKFEEAATVLAIRSNELKLKIDRDLRDIDAARDNLEEGLARMGGALDAAGAAAKRATPNFDSSSEALDGQATAANNASKKTEEVAEASNKAAEGAEKLEDSAAGATGAVGELGKTSDSTAKALVGVKESSNAAVQQLDAIRRQGIIEEFRKVNAEVERLNQLILTLSQTDLPLGDLPQQADAAAARLAELRQELERTPPSARVAADSAEIVADSQKRVSESAKAARDELQVASAEVRRLANDESASAEQKEAAQARLVEAHKAVIQSNRTLAQTQAGVNEKLRDGTANASVLADAYETLGITSARVLKEQAVNARAAFDAIVQSGAPLRDQELAWLAVAEAELKAADAAGEVAFAQAAAALQAQAKTKEQREALSDLIDGYTEAEDAAASFGETAAQSHINARIAADEHTQSLVNQLKTLDENSEAYKRLANEIRAANREAGRGSNRNPDGSLTRDPNTTFGQAFDINGRPVSNSTTGEFSALSNPELLNLLRQLRSGSGGIAGDRSAAIAEIQRILDERGTNTSVRAGGDRTGPTAVQNAVPTQASASARRIQVDLNIAGEQFSGDFDESAALGLLDALERGKRLSLG